MIKNTLKAMVMIFFLAYGSIIISEKIIYSVDVHILITVADIFFRNSLGRKVTLADSCRYRSADNSSRDGDKNISANTRDETRAFLVLCLQVYCRKWSELY